MATGPAKEYLEHFIKENKSDKFNEDTLEQIYENEKVTKPERYKWNAKEFYDLSVDQEIREAIKRSERALQRNDDDRRTTLEGACRLA